MKKINNDHLKNVIAHAKSYGFVFPSSEIYDGMNAVYDYGPYGIGLKNNIKEYWWKSMVQLRENIVGIDSAILMHPHIWKSSGHVDAFNDLMIDNKDSKRRYRVDVLIENYIEKIQNKIKKELYKAKKCSGLYFNEKKFINTDPKVKYYRDKEKKIIMRMARSFEKNDLQDLQLLIEELDIRDPETGSRNWEEVRKFNLMFKIGGTKEGIYLRPETAQGIFVNFSQVQKSARMKIPFGIAQIGKSFRNEIIARTFIFRMREFEQMEMQFFVSPGEEIKWYEYWKNSRMKWHLTLGFGKDKYRFHDHKKLAHYANAASDIEFSFPFGFRELEGIHSRTDFDLKNHEKHSRKNLKYFDYIKNQNYLPSVIETSLGLDRMFLSVFSSSLKEENTKNSKRLFLKLHPSLAPVKAAVLPLVKKDGLAEMAKKIFHTLKTDHQITYDENESIGKRYRRQDAIGTPICITIDYESFQDESITVRFRDNMKQKRLFIKELTYFLNIETGITSLLKNLY